MDYETCEKLKELGFPYTEPSTHSGVGYYILKSGLIFTTVDFIGGGLPNEEHRYIPTLSELIEACGDKFENLTRAEGEWYSNTDETFFYIGSIGKTPEESVARLWIELNKHD